MIAFQREKMFAARAALANHGTKAPGDFDINAIDVRSYNGNVFLRNWRKEPGDIANIVAMTPDNARGTAKQMLYWANWAERRIG